MVNALAASQQLVIPVQTEHLAVKGLERMVNTLAMINRSRKQALPFSIVPTLFDRRTQASMHTLRVLRDKFPDEIWQGYIPVDTRCAMPAVPVSRLRNSTARAVACWRIARCSSICWRNNLFRRWLE
jgi:cellulose biosynthesis protein BcsQ